MNITLTELRYITAVARERHFGRAAQACFVSQPTLSVGVKRLEDALGVQVFERSSRNEVRLTDAGEKLVEQAQRVLDEVEGLRQLAQSQKDPLVGPLRVGVIYTIGPYLLPGLIPALHEAAPQMPVLIEEGYTHVLAEKLVRGELDAVVLSLPFTLPGLRVAPVYREPFVVALPASHAWASHERILARDLSEADLLLLGPGHCFRDQVLGLCPSCARSASAGLMQRTLEGGSLETIRMMVATGVGVTVLPCTSTLGAAGDSGGLIVYRPFADPAPTRDVGVAWRKRFVRPGAVALLREKIIACAPPCVVTLPEAPIQDAP